MSQKFNLKAIERKAFRSVHQDGLWDIYIGGLLLVISLMLSIPESGDGKLTHFVLALLGVVVVFTFFQVGKKYITTPRLGQVRFGSERQKRKIKMTWIMGIYVLGTLGVFLYSLYVWNSSASGQVVDVPISSTLERLIVASLAALIAGTSMVVLSYFREFMRGYYIALLMASGFFFTLLLDTITPMIVAGTIVLIPGLVLFINFLRQHPLPSQKVGNGNS